MGRTVFESRLGMHGRTGLMARLTVLTATAVAAVLGIAGAQAADMPVYYEQQAAPEFGGWYIRGDIGGSHQISKDLDSPYFDVIQGAGGVLYQFDSEWAPSWFIGAGIGYQFTDSLRADITGEYRFASDFNASDAYDTGPADGTIDGTNNYDGQKEEAVFLVNAYWDLPTHGIMKPYVGAGVGASWIKISDFTDTSPNPLAIGLSGSTEQWNFAWALYAGLGFELSQNLTLDVGYRFLYLGDAETEDLLAPDGSNPTIGNSFNFNNIMSHDVKVGLRYKFN
jgi:opacity protein-like surface antigen